MNLQLSPVTLRIVRGLRLKAREVKGDLLLPNAQIPPTPPLKEVFSMMMAAPSTCQREMRIKRTNSELEERRMWRRHDDALMLETKPERNDSKGR